MAADALEDLRKVVEAQLRLVNLILFVCSEGPAVVEGVRLESKLGDARRRASAMLAMAAGQSTTTLLGLLDKRGIAVRDLYPIGRSAVEASVNAAYLMASTEDVSRRAIEHASFTAWRQQNRVIGKGRMSINLATDPPGAIEREFPDFAGKGRRNWTNLSVADRIEHVGKQASERGATRLLAAYGLVYDISSEIIHGSVAGVSYFYSAHLKEPTEDAFREGTVEQLFDIVVAASHAVAGLTATFFDLHDFEPGKQLEQKLFPQLYEIANR